MGFVETFQEPKFLSFAQSSSGHHRDLQPHHGNLGYKNDETSNIGNASFSISKSGRQQLHPVDFRICLAACCHHRSSPKAVFIDNVTEGSTKKRQRQLGANGPKTEYVPWLVTKLLGCNLERNQSNVKISLNLDDSLSCLFTSPGFHLAMLIRFGQALWCPGLWTLELNLSECRWYFESQPNHLVSFPCMMQETPISCYPTPMSHHHRHMCGYR